MQLLGNVKSEDKAVFLKWLISEYSLGVAGNNGALESVTEEGNGKVNWLILRALTAYGRRSFGLYSR